jgi:hypothetical protein
MCNTDELIRQAAMRRGQWPIFSYDRACRDGFSYQGFGLDELLRRLVADEAARHCDQCGAGDCTHGAARLVLAQMLAVEFGK